MKISRRQFLNCTAAVATLASTSALMACGDTQATSAETSATPEPTSTPEPTPTPTPEPPYNADVLTGEERAPDAMDSRIIGIMVNNISNTSYQNARPQRGIGSAKILMECKVEGGITRFCAVFSEVSEIPEIGPIRSGRDQFLQLLMPWQAVYFHEGESVFTTRFIVDWEYWYLNLGGSSYFGAPVNTAYTYRDNRGRDVASEHTAFTNGEEVQDSIDKAEIDMFREYNSKFFVFADYRYDEYNALDGAEDALSITVRHSSSYRTYFSYDEANKVYGMSQYSSASGSISETKDELTGDQLTFTNVFVLFTEISDYPGDSSGIQSVDFRFGGVGYYFTNGKAKLVHWSKGSPNAGLIIKDPTGADDENLMVNIGKSYLSFVDLDEYEYFEFKGNEAVEDDVSDAADMTDVTDSEEGSEEAASGIDTQ